LLSAALVAEVDRLIREGKLFISSGASAVIRDDQGRKARPATEGSAEGTKDEEAWA
jgi:hypothetical protein